MKYINNKVTTMYRLIVANLPILMFLTGFVVLNIGVYHYLGVGVLVFLGISLIVLALVVESSIKELENKEKIG